MALTITINGEDKTKKVDWRTLQITNVLTDKVDKCRFDIRSYSGNAYTPYVGREVIITLNGTKMFGGVIANVESKHVHDDLVIHRVECSDYTRLLGQKLVPDSFENETAEDIITSLIATYAPAGFTTANVNAAVPVKYIGFNYKSLHLCLEELAKLIDYDYYIDYDKDVHFFERTQNAAPVDIQDDNGTYIKGTLIIRRDNSQTRNSIVVRGGEYEGVKFTSELLTDGTKWIYEVPYKYNEFAATLSTNPLSIGVDYIDDADDYDALYNYQEKILRFKEADKPNASKTLRVSGKPKLPVIVKLKSQSHINTMVSMEGGSGIYEYLIIDKSIDSKEGARQRAESEINAYAQTLSEAEFETETDGLRAGQRIRINSTAMGIDSYFVINKVTAYLATADASRLHYYISLLTTRTSDMVDVLKKLLLAETKKLEINADEIIDLVESYPDEEVAFAETLTYEIEHNLQAEQIDFADTFTAQSLDYDVQFVLGPYTWGGEGSGDPKRVFKLGGSRLG